MLKFPGASTPVPPVATDIAAPAQAEQRPEPSASRPGDRLQPPRGNAMKRVLGQLRPRTSGQDDRIEPAGPLQREQDKGKGKAEGAELNPELDPVHNPGGLYEHAIAHAIQRAKELGQDLPRPKRANGKSLLGKLRNDKFYTKVKPQLRRDAPLVQAGLLGLGVPPLTPAHLRAVLLAGLARKISDAPLKELEIYLKEKIPDTVTDPYSVSQAAPSRRQRWFMKRAPMSFADLGLELHNKLEDDWPLHEKLLRTLARRTISAVLEEHDRRTKDHARSGMAYMNIQPRGLSISAAGRVQLPGNGGSHTDNGDFLFPRHWVRVTEEHREGNSSSTGQESPMERLVYALGETLYELAEGSGYTDEDIEKNTENAPFDSLAKVAAQMMHKNPQRRPSLNEVLHMPFFTSADGIFSERALARQLRKLRTR